MFSVCMCKMQGIVECKCECMQPCMRVTITVFYSLTCVERTLSQHCFYRKTASHDFGRTAYTPTMARNISQTSHARARGAPRPNRWALPSFPSLLCFPARRRRRQGTVPPWARFHQSQCPVPGCWCRHCVFQYKDACSKTLARLLTHSLVYKMRATWGLKPSGASSRLFSTFGFIIECNLFCSPCVMTLGASLRNTCSHSVRVRLLD
jgi:hypothetical protein